MLEREAWKLLPEERLAYREAREVSVIDEMILRANSEVANLLPKSKFCQALRYFIGLAPYLKNYIDYPDARLDNNVAERAIRPLALGRKNWLFMGSIRGGDAAAVILTLVQSCRSLGVNPTDYLNDILVRLPSHSNQRLAELLPQQWALGRSKESGL